MPVKKYHQKNICSKKKRIGKSQPTKALTILSLHKHKCSYENYTVKLAFAQV
nr:MAG TPA: hypothetical protein [Caudoviricetes sp.]DAG07650.1 MAG TPA: hypothetical protein [Caudoviricetes sp.]